MEIGIKNICKITVTEDKTAKAMGSGELEVLATPAMITLMELTAAESVKPFIGDGMSTVGTYVAVSHISATPLGMEVRCESELTEIDRRSLTFAVKAYDECGLIGEGTHRRFIVDAVRFAEKTNLKKEQK